MKEIQEILKKTERLTLDEKAVLATVVDVKGSSYRLPGAKMLILENGETFGTVSGGCLEADVLERAKRVLRTGEPQIFTYDTTTVEDSIFNLNMGCRGVIRILLESFSNEYFNFLKSGFEKRRNSVAATITETSDAGNFPIGKRFYFDERGKILNDEPNNLPAQFYSSAADVLKNNRSRSENYEIENGAVEAFFEFVEPPLNLLIFGAGADAVPVADIAKTLGWRISIIDYRPAFAAPERFPSADEILLLRAENFQGNLTIDENTAAVVMSHNYGFDREILRFLLNSPARYIGALGPKRRAENLLAELRDAGENFTPGQLDKLFAPVGLDIGANAPEAIALSIVAEIQSFSAGRSGGFLRNRVGSIYDRNS